MRVRLCAQLRAWVTWAGIFTSCCWSPTSSLGEASSILASHPGQSYSVYGWWCTPLGSWHLSCILSAPIWQRHCLNSLCHSSSSPPPPCSWLTVLFKISSRRRHCRIRFWAFRMLFFPRCEDSMDGGQLHSVSIHVLRVLNMQEMIALCLCLLLHSSHHIFVFAQDWKEVIALDVLFFYQLEKYLTVSCLNVAFHTVPAFVGGGAWVISFCVSYCPGERKTEPQCLECQWLSKFLAGLPLVPITTFGPRKDSCIWVISGRGSESQGKWGLRSWWWCDVPAPPWILNVLLHACLVLKCWGHSDENVLWDGVHQGNRSE